MIVEELIYALGWLTFGILIGYCARTFWVEEVQPY